MSKAGIYFKNTDKVLGLYEFHHRDYVYLQKRKFFQMAAVICLGKAKSKLAKLKSKKQEPEIGQNKDKYIRYF